MIRPSKKTPEEKARRKAHKANKQKLAALSAPEKQHPFMTWKLKPAFRGGPLEVAAELFIGVPVPHPKPKAIRSPTWLRLVRLMNCSGCGKPAPSEANHCPGKGRSGGGSDLEVHPVCRDCHQALTDDTEVNGKRPLSFAEQMELVERTQWKVLRNLSEGKLRPEVLLACMLEASVN